MIFIFTSEFLSGPYDLGNTEIVNILKMIGSKINLDPF